MIQKFPDYTYGFSLILADMPSLENVCVWETPFPPENNSSKIDVSGSANIVFSDCTNSASGTDRKGFSRNEDLHIYPNPGDGLFTLETGNPSSANVVVFNSSGELVYERDIMGVRENIDLRNLPRGIYIVRIRHENMFQSKKIVIR